MPSSNAIVARTIQKAADQMAVEYRAERATDAERLYNAFAEVIGEQHPSVEVLVYVLEVLKFSLMTEKYHEHFTPAGTEVPVPVNLNGVVHSHAE